MMKISVLGLASIYLASVDGFVAPSSKQRISPQLRAVSVEEDAKKNNNDAKQKLRGLIGKQGYVDGVLADPDTKEPLRVIKSGVLLGGDETNGAQRTKLDLQSTTNTYRGTSDTFVNLLEPVKAAQKEEGKQNFDFAHKLPKDSCHLSPHRFDLLWPLQVSLWGKSTCRCEIYSPRWQCPSPTNEVGDKTLPRQDSLDPTNKPSWQWIISILPLPKAEGRTNVLVDMSCATGLFTRRLTKSSKYDRVLGCDYSESMLQEARRRIQADPSLSPRRRKTQLDLVRCDVGRIPFRTESVDAFHAGAAMHCWPELPLAASEIYRVLKPQGRYFATTFLSSWFGNLQAAEGGANGPSRQAFQYFESTDQLRSLMEEGGFAPDNVSIEVIEPAAVVIRCEK